MVLDAKVAAANAIVGQLEELGLSITLDQQILDLTARIEHLDRLLLDAKHILVAKPDLDFKPDGWNMPLGEAIDELSAQRARVIEHRAKLQAQAPEPSPSEE